MKYANILVLILILSFVSISQGQKKNKTKEVSLMQDSVFKGIEFRSIGPAFMSGRISDVEIDPNNENTWYVCAGSGGVWKTKNAGITWEAIFENESSYSIGCVTVNPANSEEVWVGTGENIGGRHVGFGDGIYKSEDGGKSWKNLGLKKSEHISEIIIHPDNSNKIYVAVQGPLWSSGGERGFYYSHDGGKSWKKTLGDDKWVGVTDIAMDPRNPQRIYAATWQRHRNVAAYMGGGPGTSIYRSEDGGMTWKEIKNGLPASNMGKIGIAISPQKPDIIYAAIELDHRKGGVFKSENRGNSWEKQSDAVSGATGPHYYQELYASPHKFDKLYLVDVRAQVSEDGGKTFRTMNEEYKHSDNHAIAFKANDPDYILVGTDGGLYESFDGETNWRYFKNLPLTQFYKVAVDDAEPFYNVYGGTQDNNTQGGPSRTDNAQGIQNSDWKVVLDWDGHQPATEPGNPNIMYGERQEGNLSRIDLSTGEIVDIQPQPAEGEEFERYNWDAPILVSPHKAQRIFFASQRVWQSEDRGDSWKAISGDLTRNQERIALPIMGKKQSYDNAWDFLAMSNYNTITSLAESPKKSGLIYAGTDDGIIQVTDNGGESWRKIEVSRLPGVPSTAFVNDIKADLYDEGTVYVCLDNHKYGDFRPFVFKSTDKGNTWTNISSNLPKRTLAWRIVQDHENKNLLFLATEFGIYFSINGGSKWVQLKGGLPTISFRDLAIQKRENDLVGASFGRSFYILDDYSFLREVSESTLKGEFKLFPVKDTWWYFPRPHLSFYGGKASQGADHFVAPNPDFGAVFTFYLKEDIQSLREQRQAKEKKAKSASFQGWDKVEAEDREMSPQLVFTIEDANSNIINRVYTDAKKGFHRINWDLRHPAPDALDYDDLEEDPEYPSRGLMCMPGKYKVSAAKMVNGVVTDLGQSQEFEVKRLYEGAIASAEISETSAFWRAYEDLEGETGALAINISNSKKTLDALNKALKNSQSAPGKLDEDVSKLRNRVLDLDMQFSGQSAKNQIGEKTKPNIPYRMFQLWKGVGRSAHGPTKTNLETKAIIEKEVKVIKAELTEIDQEISRIKSELEKLGAPYIEGSPLK